MYNRYNLSLENSNMLKFLDNMSLFSLVFLAVILGITPYPMEAEPHSIQKITMLINGELSKPIDILDLIFHITPTILLGIKLYRMYVLKLPKDEKSPDLDQAK